MTNDLALVGNFNFYFSIVIKNNALAPKSRLQSGINGPVDKIFERHLPWRVLLLRIHFTKEAMVAITVDTDFHVRFPESVIGRERRKAQNFDALAH